MAKGEKHNEEMYNEEQKKAYIDYEKNNAQGLTQYFKRLCGAEKICNKDIADMNTEELKAALSSLEIRSILSRTHIINLLRGYMNWAVAIGRTSNENKIDNIKPEDIASKYAVKTQMLSGPGQIKHILEKAFKQGFHEQENRKIYYELVFWLLYAGMDTSELQLLKKTDIDYDKKLVISPKYENVNYHIDENMIRLWDKCADMDYIEKSGGRHGTGIVRYELVYNEYLFRPVLGKKTDNNKKMNKALLDQIINKILISYREETQEYISVTPLNVRLSGKFYQMYLYEKEGNEFKPETICEILNLGYSSRKIMVAKARSAYNDYEDWKEAFGYN